VKGFYSPVDKLAAELPRTKGTGAEFMTELSKRPGYKPQEAQDRDLQTLMALPKMAREEFLAKLKSKPAPQLEETTLAKSILRNPGLNVDPDSSPKYEEHTLPGGSNYREILMRMPHDEQRAKEFSDPASGHWDTPNVLAHVRAKDRTGPNGEKLLHIEEIQSDWHQQGREHGYATPETLKEFRAAELRHKQLKRQLDEAKAQSESAENSLKRKEPLFQQPDVRERYEAARVKANNDLMDLMPQVMKAQAEVQDFGHKMNSMVPNAPFKKNWHEMALKKMIHHAAENGYHGIVITPGEEQAKRYDLSKHVGMVSYHPEQQRFQAFKPNRETLINETGATPERVAELIGKDAAARLMDAPQNMGHHYLEGENLRVGGEGMKGFYDKMVPSFLNQFGKKYGAQVQPGSVSIVSTPAQHHGLTESQFQAQSPDEQQRMVRQHAYAHQGAKTEVPVHHFPITPEMREDVTKNGVPLYAEGGSTNRINMHHKDVIKRIPELTAAANEVEAGNMTYDQYQALVNKHKPVMPFASVPDMPSDEEIHNALTSDKREKIGAHRDIENGTHVGGRLDIPAYKDHGVWVVSVHEGKNGANAGPPIGYDSHLHIINPKFGVSVKGAMNYATGKKDKNTFATVNGAYNKLSRKQAKAMANLALNHKDWIQVGMDPERHTHFYDRATQRPIKEAAESLQIGPMVFVKHPVYHTDEEMQQFPYAKGGAVKPVGYMAGGSIEYQGEHEPPSESYGAPLHDLTQVYPEDIYSNKALQYYGMGHPEHKKMDMESLFKAQLYRNKPNASVSVFRAVPEHVNEINPSDWVTLSPAYAKLHGESRLGGKYKTLKKMVKAKELWTAGDSIHEWGYHPEEKKAKGGSVMGINVRSDKKANLQYADLIVDGHKTYESRNGDTLRPYVGKRVSIVRTGDGPAKAIGAVTVGEPLVVDRKKFRKMEQHHLVPEGSTFDITSGTKHLYPMHDPERYESERDVGHGIVARKVHMAKGGAIKPVGYTKEKVTVSPSLDQMMYELISVKHSKKVK